MAGHITIELDDADANYLASHYGNNHGPIWNRLSEQCRSALARRKVVVLACSNPSHEVFRYCPSPDECAKDFEMKEAE